MIIVASTRAVARPTLTSSLKLVIFNNVSGGSPAVVAIEGTDAAAPAGDSVTAEPGAHVLSSVDFETVSLVALTVAQGGTVTVRENGTPATGALGVSGATFENGQVFALGVSGISVSYTLTTSTPSAPYQVKIEATDAGTVANLRAAIDASAGAGTAYGAGTLAHPQLASTGISGTTISLTDRVGAQRLFDFICSDTSPFVFTDSMSGAEDGPVVATIPRGLQVVTEVAVKLDDEYLTLNKLPASTNWVSDGIAVSGKPFSLHISAENVTTPMVTSYEYSTQQWPDLWRAGSVSVTDLDNNSQVITPPEIVEHVRVRINNTNTSAVSANVKLLRQ